MTTERRHLQNEFFNPNWITRASPAIPAGALNGCLLMQDMDEGRRRRLVRLGFAEQVATELSSLHTRNFM